MEIFTQLGLILLITATISIIARVFSQPLIVGYIISGIIVGPFGINIIGNSEYLDLFSQIGIAILLFIVGLSLNPETIRENGRAAILTGLGQIIITSLIGYIILICIGWDNLPAIYGAVAITFSSTVIVLKMLSDRGDINKLYGRLSIGFLLIQDVVAALLLAFIPLLGVYLSGGNDFGKVFTLLAFKGVLISIFLYFIAKKILPKLSDYLAKTQELLFLFSITWGLIWAGIFHKIGFSIEMGALIAGITLSASNYAVEISSKIKPLRDFCIIIFFILLGSRISWVHIYDILTPTIILSLSVLIINPIVVYIILNIMRYSRRTSYMSALSVTQISEFSLIVLALGLSYHHINQNVVSTITLVAVITISISSYMMIYADYIYKNIQGLLSWLEIMETDIIEEKESKKTYKTIIFGYGRAGLAFVKAVKKENLSYLVVDYNPDTAKDMRGENINFKYGDADDIEFLDEIYFTKAKLIISTIPNINTNLLLLSEYKKKNKTGDIIIFAQNKREAERLYGNGASYVIIPHYLGANHISQILENAENGKYDFEKVKKVQSKLWDRI